MVHPSTSISPNAIEEEMQLLPVFGGAVGATIGLDVVVVADGVDGRRSEKQREVRLLGSRLKEWSAISPCFAG